MSRHGSLFSGAGALDLAAMSMLGGSMAWFAEDDPAASGVLAHHWPATPNHGDVTTVDWSAVEPVDVLTAGWPCQPWSTAGRRKGADDERALWPEVARAVRAPAAHPNGEGRIGAGTSRAELCQPDRPAAGRDDPHPAADADRDGREVVQRVEPGLGAWGDADGCGSVDWSIYEPAIRRHERVLGRPAPAPTVAGARGAQRLSPAFAEWMMMWPAGWVTDVPGLTRNQMIAALGNGVVLPCAAAAIAHLSALLADSGWWAA